MCLVLASERVLVLVFMFGGAKMRRVNLALSCEQLAQLKALSPVRRKQWARPVFEPIVELLLAVGDLDLVRQFSELGPDVIRTAIQQTISEHGAEHKRGEK